MMMCETRIFDMFHTHWLQDGAWIFEMYMKCKYKCNCKSKCKCKSHFNTIFQTAPIFPNDPFSLGVLTKILYAFCISSIHAIRHAHLAISV